MNSFMYYAIKLIGSIGKTLFGLLDIKKVETLKLICWISFILWIPGLILFGWLLDSITNGNEHIVDGVMGLWFPFFYIFFTLSICTYRYLQREEFNKNYWK